MGGRGIIADGRGGGPRQGGRGGALILILHFLTLLLKK